LKRIFAYIEDAPVHRDVMAHGMHRAGPPILRAVQDYIDGIALYQYGHRYMQAEYDRDLAPLCAELPRFPTLVCKVLRRFPAFARGISDALPARLFTRTVRRSKATYLFTYVGADPTIMTRAANLAARTGTGNVFYVVDDFLAPLRITGATEDTLQREQKRAAKALAGAKHIFTITDGLGAYLKQNFGVESTTLKLAFEPDPVLKLAPKPQILYMGSINFLYAACLRELFRIVERVRRSTGIDVTVRLMTVSPLAMVKELLGDLPEFVISEPAKDADDLKAEITSSLFTFLPYSFDAQEKPMVSTSFPSKALEYLAYARSIVVYGPEYGVATKLFRETKMPTVVTTAEALEQEIKSHFANWPDYSETYRSYLSQSHSLTAARRTICTDLKLEAD